MKMSCNGCRVLRKACNDKCNIRPCLEWITNPEAQANVTVFLAKFYGRAGLTNLLNAGPDRNRPAIFRSMLYEACGRIVNPIYGSVGLLWSGSWQLNQAAVEAVLRGEPIRQMPLEAATAPSRMPAAYDIRHFSRVPAPAPSNRMAVELHKVMQARTGQFKRSGAGKKATGAAAAAALELAESSGSHVTEDVAEVTSAAVQGEPAGAAAAAFESNELGLELTLGGVYGYRAAN